MSRDFDAVVIGSGFGGSIHALRLAEANKSALVLERGCRYRPEDFPRDVTDVDRLFWDYPRRRRSRGLYDLRFHSGLATVTASGVGGGSLVYANIHIRPDARIFEDRRWPAGIDRANLDPYYDKVAAELQIAPLPVEHRLPKRDRFRLAAEKLEREVFDPDQAVSWHDPGVPGRYACELIAQCEFGCPKGAKNTLDVTYLGRAERLGSEVRTGCAVSHVEPAGGGYRVHYEHTDGSGRESVTGRRVIVSAGTLGTNEILLRSRDVTRTLPRLSTCLGQGFSANGDFLGAIQGSDVDLEPWRGPDVTSVIKYFDAAPEFTMAAPTFNREVMEVLAAAGPPLPLSLGPLGGPLWRRSKRAVRALFWSGLLRRPPALLARRGGDPARMTNLFAIGRDNAGGRLVLERGRLDVRWDYAAENYELIARMERAMKELAELYGGSYAPLPNWRLFKRIITVHPLGGCHLGESPALGVVSPDGQVHHYDGLYVADGSVIPTAIGFHPVMTISAVCERIAERVAASYSS